MFFIVERYRNGSGIDARSTLERICTVIDFLNVSLTDWNVDDLGFDEKTAPGLFVILSEMDAAFRAAVESMPESQRERDGISLEQISWTLRFLSDFVTQWDPEMDDEDVQKSKVGGLGALFWEVKWALGDYLLNPDNQRHQQESHAAGCNCQPLNRVAS